MTELVVPYTAPSTGRLVRAVLFDTFGIVAAWCAGIVAEVSAFAARHALTLDAYAYAYTWRGLYQPSPARRTAPMSPTSWAFDRTLYKTTDDGAGWQPVS